MYRSEFRKFKDINIFTLEEKALIEKFIEFDENIFHRIDLNNKEIYWVKAWRLKIKYLQNVNNLLELICNLYDAFNIHKEIFIKKNFLELHRFIDFFFDWNAIGTTYDNLCRKKFAQLHQYLKCIFDDKPEKFLNFMKKINKINKINKKKFLKDVKDLKKINYKMKKI